MKMSHLWMNCRFLDENMLIMNENCSVVAMAGPSVGRFQGRSSVQERPLNSYEQAQERNI
jgi:hypothetical protein